MTEEEIKELERLRLGAAGQRASDDYEAMVNAPSNKVNIPSFGQPAPGIIPALPAMPTVDQAAPAMPEPFGFAPTESLTSGDRANLLGSQQLDTAISGGNMPESGLDRVAQSQPLTQGQQADLTEGQMLDSLRLGGARNLSEALDAPMPVTNVGLMGEPLREQPSVEQIRFDSRPDRLASKDLATRDEGFLKGLARVFYDPLGTNFREAERYAPRNQPLDIVPSGNTMRPDTPMLDSVMNSGIGPFQPGAVDFSRPATTDATSGDIIELAPLTRTATPPEATFLRADGSIGEIFPGQRIGDAFPGNPDTPLVGSPLVPGQQTYQGVDLPGGVGFVRAPEGMVKTIGPDGRMIFATPEQANAIASSMNGPASAAPVTPSAPGGPVAPGGPQSRLGEFSEMISNNADRILDVARPLAPGVTGVIDAIRGFDDAKSAAKTGLDYLTDPRQPSFKTLADERAAAGVIPQGQSGSIQDNFVKRMATGQPLTQAETASAMEFARSKGLNFDPRTGYSQAPMARGPQVSMGTAPQGRPTLSQYEQASMDREGRIAARGRLPGETQAQADTRIAQSRTQGSNQGQLSQADLRDLAKGSARGASTGDRARALEIQQRAGMGVFKPEDSKVDKLSQATSTVDRMIQNGQLSPDKRNAAIQKIVGLGDVGGAAGSGSAGAGVIGSAEFDRVASQLQEGGSLYNMGIRVDPSRVDPNTGAALIYREDDGGFFGSSFETPVSQELMQQLLPYARSVRQGGTLTQDFTGMGMTVNQFAGSR